MANTVLSALNVSKSYSKSDGYALEHFCIDVKNGDVVCLVGPSGSGKTTFLRLVAGLEVPTSGSMRVKDQIFFDESTFIPTEKRGVGMVFQEHALFPHLSVFDNVAFGLEKRSKSEKSERVHEILTLVGLKDYQDRYPHQLSGGQQQRVALARSLAPAPDILLLDEPFSNLDEELSLRLRHDLVSIIKESGTTCIVVTHKIEDAFAIADTIAMLRDGSLIQKGSPEVLYSHPKNEEVAQFFGRANILEGVIHPDGIKTDIGFFETYIQPYFEKNARIKVCIRPEHLAISQSGAENETNVSGTVKKIVFGGRYKALSVLIPSYEGNELSEITLHVNSDEEVDVGDEITFSPDPGKIVFLE